MKIEERVKRMIISHVSNRKRAELIKKWYGVHIGSGCEVYKGVTFGSEAYLISIGDNVRITTGVKFCTHDGGMWVLRNMKINEQADLFGPIVVGSNVHIGWDAVIMPNVTIGNNCIIAIGAVVTHDVPDNSIVAGVPARVIRTIDEYYLKNKDRILETKGLSAEDKKRAIYASIL